MRTTLLAQAIRENRGELVALCLLLGMVESLKEIPSDSVEGLLDLLEGSEGENEHRS